MPTTRTPLLIAAGLLLVAPATTGQPLEVPARADFGRLTVVADDGRQVDCQLRSLQVRVWVEGDLARTEVEQVFANPLPGDQEGSFEFELPPGAAVNRLALEIDGKLVEGELVERQKARMVYERIVRQMRDPALMEWQGGDRFKTQVYPVPGNGTKRVVLAYLTRLERKPGWRVYRYRLPSTPEGAKGIPGFRFDARFKANGRAEVTPYDAQIKPDGARLDRSGFRPRGELILRIPAAEPARQVVRLAKAGGERIFSLDFDTGLPEVSRSGARHINLLVDTSGSLRGPAWEQVGQALEQILTQLGPDDRIRLITGDVSVRKPGPWLAAGQAAGLKAKLAKLEPAGGTDLLALLLAGATKPPKGGRSLAIYLGDGQASLGELDGDLLLAQVRKAYRAAGASLSAVGLGPSPSTDYLRRLARATGGRIAVKEPGRPLALGPLMAALSRTQLADPVLTFAGNCAAQVVPARLDSVAPGERLRVMGLLKAKGRCRATLGGTFAGKAFARTLLIDPTQAGKAELLPVFWARERIAHLEAVAGDRREIIELSKRFGIMSRYTSWLVLENEEAYKKHQIEQRQRDQRRAQEQAAQARPDKPAGPLTKKKLEAGESMADVLKNYSDDDAGADGLDAKDKEMDAAPPPPPSSAPMEMEKVMSEAPMARPKPAKKAKGKREYKPLTGKQQLARAESQLEADPRGAYPRQQLVSLLVSQKKTAEARKRVTAWAAEGRYTATELVQLVIRPAQRLPDDAWTRNKLVELWERALELEPGNPGFRADLVAALDEAGKTRQALALMAKARADAKGDTDRLLALIPAYGKLAEHAAAKQALLDISAELIKNRPLDAHIRRVHLDQLKAAGLTDQALAAVIDWRRYAPDFPDLVLEQAAMLAAKGDGAGAERVLTELVEFNPHDYAARARYAQELAAKGRPEEACAQYTRAVQLNPSKRDTFRTMMGLRRSHPKAGKAIGQCIVDGVSRLPVIRDVSIVMLWEDPSADIDMHVTEAGGERVWYQHQESAQGGHLYYDVTDGFGPEVYVLGAGKPGTYRLEVVYYSGSRPVRGKFILMRNAGGPEETRKEIPFKLQSANSDKRVPVTVFKISR